MQQLVIHDELEDFHGASALFNTEEIVMVATASSHHMTSKVFMTSSP